MPANKLITVKENFDVERVLIRDLAERFSEYPDAYILIDSGYYGHETQVAYSRMETEDEMNARLVLEALEDAKQKLKDERKKEAARKEFEKLKKTYGFE
jgi:hypothetical protein